MAVKAMQCELHHDYTSICSIMARYTFAVRGEPMDDKAKLEVTEKAYHIRQGEQLTEHFLCDINRNGEVPVLVPFDQDGGQLKPIPDSVDITYFFASRYPSLMPKEREQEVKRLIASLHEINFFSLTFTGKPEIQRKNIAGLKQKIEAGVSERYHAAIEYKIQRIQSRKLDGLEPQNVQQAIDNTKAFFGEITQLLSRSKTGWILDTSQPTALDAHVVVFVCRLQDVHRENLIPDRVRQFAEVAMSESAWKETMQGRRTFPVGGF